jgi:integrase
MYESASIRLSTEHKGRRRQEPVWIGRYRVAGKDSAKVLGKAWTKRSRPPAGYLTRACAEDALRLFLEAEGGRLVAAGGFTFGRAADDYIASLENRIRSGSFRASTLRTYSNIIEAELRPRWGEQPISTVTRENIEAYRAELVERNLAAGTINQTRAIVRGIFAVATLDDDPSVAFARAKTRRAASGSISFYTPAEVLALADHAPDRQDRALYLTAAFTGLRASELRALRWRSINFGDSLVQVGKGYTDGGRRGFAEVLSRAVCPKVALRQQLAEKRDRSRGADGDALKPDPRPASRTPAGFIDLSGDSISTQVEQGRVVSCMSSRLQPFSDEAVGPLVSDANRLCAVGAIAL